MPVRSFGILILGVCVCIPTEFMEIISEIIALSSEGKFYF